MGTQENLNQFKIGECHNVGNCAHIGERQAIRSEIANSGGFKCKYCGEPLQETKKPKSFWEKYGKAIMIVAAILVLTGVGLGIYKLVAGSSNEATETEPDKTAYVQQLSINGGDFTLKVGGSKQLETTVAPEQHDETLAWSSDNEAVATVDNAGKVTAKQEGTANIKITADKSGISSSVKVTVKKKDETPTPVGPVRLGYADVNVTTGKWPNASGRMKFKSSHVIDSRDPKGRVAEPGDYVIGEWVNGHLVQGKWYGADNQVKGSILIGQ